MEIVLPKGSDKLIIKGNANAWLDFGFILEAVGMMVAQVAREGNNPQGLKTVDEVITYAKEYIDKSGHDYQKNWSAQVPKI